MTTEKWLSYTTSLVIYAAQWRIPRLTPAARTTDEPMREVFPVRT